MPYKLQADLFDELGRADDALESYGKVYALTKKNPRAIPLEYLDKIDPKVAEKIRKTDKEAKSNDES